jgi:uncharacterized protein
MERNVTLDFVRGIAILGILLLNITAFGLPKAAYLNPAWSGTITLSDAWTWAVLDLFAQVKFLSCLRFCLARACKCCYLAANAGSSRVSLLVLLGLFMRWYSGMAIFCWPMGWWGLLAGA